MFGPCYVILFLDALLKLSPCCHMTVSVQSELPRPIPHNSVESDHGCTSGIYFDNAGDNLTLTINTVTLTSQKPC